MTVFIQTPVVSGMLKYLKLFSISLGSPLVAFEREIFKLTLGCLTKIEPK